MIHARVHVVAAICCLHCQGTDVTQTHQLSAMPQRSDPVAMADDESTVDASVSRSSLASDWCGRLGETDSEALVTVRDIVAAYLIAQSMDCNTAGLTASLTDEQFCTWIQYLTDYTFLMAGCVPNFDTVEGGTSRFGPANTPFTGASRDELTQAEADALARYYLEAFAMTLELSPDDREKVRLDLARAAQQDVDSMVTPSLSTCTTSDAGSP